MDTETDARRLESEALAFAGAGAVLIAMAILFFVGNLNAVPSFWSGGANVQLFFLFLDGAIGVALLWYGSARYKRVQGAKTR